MQSNSNSNKFELLQHTPGWQTDFINWVRITAETFGKD